MRNSLIHVMEMIFGVILLAFGLIYLYEQEKSLNRLINIVNNEVVETNDIYQQSNDINENIISDENLVAIVMGYREYPITINEIEIDVDGMDYDYYFTLIKSGSYQRSYEFDAAHNIINVNYTYMGI